MRTSAGFALPLLLLAALGRAWGAEPDAWPFDLAAAANMGFVDQLAGDGAGGWTDQGPDRSFPDFNYHRSELFGVPIHVTDPTRNQGRAVLSFRHRELPRGLERASVPAPAGARGRWLYLLHTAAWCPPEIGVVGQVRVRGVDGGVRTCEVRAGREVGDWAGPSDLDNGAVLRSTRPGVNVGVFLSRLDLGAEVEAASLELEPTGKAMWLVLAATLSAVERPLPRPTTLSIAAGEAWKPIPVDDLFVKPGTALDCSAFVDHAPAGSRGRVQVSRDGHLAFADGAPVRFFGASLLLHSARPRSPEEVEAWAEALRLQGYNLVRLHFLDIFLAGTGRKPQALSEAEIAAYDARAAAGEAIFDPASLDLVDRLVAALKRRGIYLYLDAMTSWTGYYPVSPWSNHQRDREDLKSRLYGDERARRHYADTVRALFTHRNPYTGTTLAEDPQVATVLGFNEQEVWFHLFTNWKLSLLAPWRRFLAERYPDAAAWRAAWGASADRIDQAPIFSEEDLVRPGAPAVDTADFLAAIEVDNAAFMEGVLRSTGYTGIFSHYDVMKTLRVYLARARLGAVSAHSYFAHPTDFSDAFLHGRQVDQSSALGQVMSWWRPVAAQRIAGQPLLLTEYGHAHWNRYRYEEGLSVGAYAALQGHDLLMAHAQQVMPKGRRILPFYIADDPVARASQVVTGHAWRTARVARAPHRIDLPLPRSLALARQERAVSGEQSRLALITGLAVAVEGGPVTTAPDLVIPLKPDGTTVSVPGASAVVDGGDGSCAGTVDLLRRRGLLPAANRSDPATGVFESETGEILLESRLRRLRVSTPALAGICADQVPAPLDAGALRLERASVPVGATAIALVGADLASASRLLLVLATDARNGGEAYRDQDGSSLRAVGSGPVLGATGRFAVSLRRAAGAGALRAWALALDGSRRDELAVTAAADGIRLDLDSAAWACGPTPFIELAER